MGRNITSRTSPGPRVNADAPLDGLPIPGAIEGAELRIGEQRTYKVVVPPTIQKYRKG